VLLTGLTTNYHDRLLRVYSVEKLEIFRADFSGNIDFCRMFEVNTMPTLREASRGEIAATLLSPHLSEKIIR
jgi:hypothetical protein